LKNFWFIQVNMPRPARHNTGIAVFREDLMLVIFRVYLEMRSKGCLLPRTEFIEVQDALENVVIELRVVKDPYDRRTLLHKMLQLIVEADAILREQPLTKSALAGASD
jgi:hypothetical protein